MGGDTLRLGAAGEKPSFSKQVGDHQAGGVRCA